MSVMAAQNGSHLYTLMEEEPSTPYKSQPWMLHVVLHGTMKGEVDDKELHFNMVPYDVRDIKKEVETVFSIPACVQEVEFEFVQLKDTDRVDSIRLQSGDTVFVNYKSEADCESVKVALDWMQLLTCLLQGEVPSVTNPMSFDLNEVIRAGIDDRLMEDLAFQKFSPWTCPVKQTNKMYFVDLGGLDVLMELYSMVQREAWCTSIIEMKFLEASCMCILSNLASSNDLRRLIISKDGVARSIRSFLHVPLKKGFEVVDDSGCPGRPDHNNIILVDVVQSALAILCNVCEMPEIHEELASNSELLRQLLCVSVSPTFEILRAQLVASIFLCCAHSPSVHAHLCRAEVIEGLLEACVYRGAAMEQQSTPIDLMLLKYFTQVFMAQLVLVSPSLLPPSLLEKMHCHMQELLDTADPYELMRFEETCRFSWSIFFPYVKLLYIPNTPASTGSAVLTKLQSLSIQVTIFCLISSLSRPSHQEIMVDEGLLDYVICMPWYVPGEVKAKADLVVRALAAHKPLQPPSLASIAKAKLAKVHFGLDRVVSMESIHDLFIELYPALYVST
eukprot:Em0011g543a